MQFGRLLSIFMVASLIVARGLSAQSVPQTTPRSLTVDRDPAPSIDDDDKPNPDAKAPEGTELSKDTSGRYTLRTDAYEVQLNVSVTDAEGRHADNLTKDAFLVTEDEVPQKITSFRHEDVPVSLGLLIDSSASMYDKRSAVERAAINLIRLSNPKDEAFVVDFSSRAYIDQDLTSSVDKLQQGLRFVKSTGGTAAYDAVMASANYLTRHAKNPKQVLLLVTDGEDNASRTSIENMIRRVQGLDGPAIYCVGLLFGKDIDKEEAVRARALLTRIADQTGGVAFFPKSLDDVETVASVVAEDIRTQYTVGYSSTNPPSNGGYRSVRVEVTDRHHKKLVGRTRRGYVPKTTPSLRATNSQ